MEEPSRQFQEIRDQLESMGIRGNEIYLLDLIPLIEVTWADGKVQQAELLLLREFLRKHLASLNQKAGTEVLTYKEACNFLMRFLKTRPSPRLMEILRGFVRTARLSNSDQKANEKQQLTILNFCMDIAAIATVAYPYNSHQRFDPNEKDTFLAILKDLEIPADRAVS